MSNLASMSSPDSGPKTAIPEMPRLPKSVIDRFPELKQWEEDMVKWQKKLGVVLRGTAY